MAYKDQEIEIKLQITKKEFDKINHSLRKLAEYIKFSQQVDDYYTPSRNSFLKPKYPYEWLAIRFRDNKVLLNYKHWYPEGHKYTTHCDEYETEILDSNQAEKILKALNFEKIVSVKKKRKVFLYEDNLEISLDDVENLGYFIEVETTKDFGSLKKAYKKILEFTNKMGLRGSKTVPGGYALTLLKKMKK